MGGDGARDGGREEAKERDKSTNVFVMSVCVRESARARVRVCVCVRF